jgi:hypothetical protein
MARDALTPGPYHCHAQRVKRVRYVDAADEELEDSRTDYQKQIAAKTSLVESFGARRNLQAIQSAQRNRVDTEAISGISAAISSRCVHGHDILEH